MIHVERMTHVMNLLTLYLYQIWINFFLLKLYGSSQGKKTNYVNSYAFYSHNLCFYLHDSYIFFHLKCGSIGNNFYRCKVWVHSTLHIPHFVGLQWVVVVDNYIFDKLRKYKICFVLYCKCTSYAQNMYFLVSY